MAGSVNKVIIIDLVALYSSGKSLPQVAALAGVPVSTVRYHVKKAGALRSRADGVRMASAEGRLGSGMRGKARSFSKRHCEAISSSRRAWADESATGVSLKPNGYLEYTRGENKGRSVHVVIMESRLGRRMLKDECVHHIDGVKTNNAPENLALVTRSGHTRLHRREQWLLKGMEG